MYKNIILFCLFFIFVSTGCGVRTTSVSGTVLQEGKGLENIVVLMQPISNTSLTSEAAFGKTDAHGKFSLSLIRSKKSGVIPGEYAVFINWNDPNPQPENVPQNSCPYDIPASAKEGSYRYAVESNGKQFVTFNLDEFP
jgi:hypothetical protein